METIQNFNLIKEASDFAKVAHNGQKRLSGENYFVHCFGTAKILTELGLDEETIAAGYLHDVLEDTEVEYDEIENKFGKNVAELVEGVTKISFLKDKSIRTNNSETIRKMLISAATDVRSIIVKLADRLHNMRTLQYLKEEKRLKFSRETLEIYSNLAYRLGLITLKCELEDLAFRNLEPLIYEEFKKKVAKTKNFREKEISSIIGSLNKVFFANSLNVKILGRPKHFYSIYRKMKLKNTNFEGIYDLIGLRVVTSNVEECYEILGIVHNLWKPLPLRFKDYIANPKPNFYQSLHTCVLTEAGQLVEVQIRTKEMDDVAELGIAAHWKYKGLRNEEKFDKKLNWLKQILSLKDENSRTFMKNIKLDLFGNNIFVFTPKGRVIELPEKSTPVDFAYAVHSDVGERCSGVRINKKFVSLKYELTTGDVVEILTSKGKRPSRDWLKFVRTSKALSKIKRSLKMDQGIPGRNIKIIKDQIELSGDIIYVEGMRNFDVRFSSCCDPLPGDSVLGYDLRTKVIVHNKKCKNLIKIKRDLFDVQWLKNFNTDIRLKINALDRVGIFADILNTVAATGTSIKYANAKLLDEYNSECILTISFDGLDHLKGIVDRIKKIADVRRVRLE